jgi:hypothetical protein
MPRAMSTNAEKKKRLILVSERRSCEDGNE